MDNDAANNHSHIISQVTNDTRMPASTEMVHSSSDVNLPRVKHAKSMTYMRSCDRLYYEHKMKSRYGKINELLSEVISEVVEPVDLLAAKEKVTRESKSKLKRLPRIDYIGSIESLDMKRQIFLANYSIDAKKEGIENMHRYMKMQEEALHKQIKLEKESEYLLKSFMKENIDSVRQVKERHLKLEEEKLRISDQVSALKSSIIDEGYAIRGLKDDIHVKFG